MLEQRLPIKNKSETKIVFLGTGNPNPDPDHQGPSLAIIVNNRSYIVDFGVGLVRQAARFSEEFGGCMAALDSKNMEIGFLTHLHSDHILGYPDLILTPWIMVRENPLTVYGPVGTRGLTDHILRAYESDIQYRLKGSEPINQTGWQVHVHEFRGGTIFEDDVIKVEAFPVTHGSMNNAFGFRFVTPDKVIVVSGDTAPCDTIQDFSKRADVLIHEVYSQKGFSQKKDDWQKYHRTHHTSTIQLGKMMRIAKPKLVVLYHTLFWGASEDEILSEICDVYDGEVILSLDLMIVS